MESYCLVSNYSMRIKKVFYLINWKGNINRLLKIDTSV